VTALLLVLTPLRAVAFALVQQGLFGLYLGGSFAPNHKGMPTLTEADQLDFMRRQVLTSGNVRGSRFVDLLLGASTIDHHLFPNMPRPNLRHAQPLVREFCRQHDLPYAEATLFGSYAEASATSTPSAPPAASTDSRRLASRLHHGGSVGGSRLTEAALAFLGFLPDAVSKGGGPVGAGWANTASAIPVSRQSRLERRS
jgi:hypothetical protein